MRDSTSVAGSVLYGAANLFHPRMLWLMLWPMLVAVGLWGVVAFVLWTRLAVEIADLLARWIEPAAAFVHMDFGQAALVAANVLLFLAFVPLVYLTALFILGLFGMQKMVDHVAARAFPHLERRHGGGTAGSISNAIAALLGMAGLALVTLPLWIVPPLWPLIPLVILGWGNQRLLRYDALCEHADRQELARIFRERRGSLYLLGLLLAIAAYVPFLGLVAPVVFGLAFIRYLLGVLDDARKGELVVPG